MPRALLRMQVRQLAAQVSLLERQILGLAVLGCAVLRQGSAMPLSTPRALPRLQIRLFAAQVSDEPQTLPCESVEQLFAELQALPCCRSWGSEELLSAVS